MPVKNQSNESDLTPDHAKEGKVPQRKDNSGRSKGAQDEEKIQSSATTANPSPFTPGPDQQSAHCQLPKQTGTSQRRKCAGATPKIPETMPVKNQSNESDLTPDHAKEGKVPQRKDNSGRSKGAQDEEKIQSSATTANPSPFTPGPDQQSAHCQLPKQTGTSQRRKCAGATPKIPETMPVKNQSNESDLTPDHAKEGKVPQRKDNSGRSKGAQDEEKIQSSATTANPSPFTPGPDQQSAHCQLPKQTGTSQRRKCAGATPKIPETMPVKNQSNESDLTPDHAKEGKVPQRKDNSGRSKGAQDEEKIQSSATTANPSPFTPGPDQQSAHCQLPKQTGTSQRRKCAGATPKIPETMPVKNQSNESDLTPDHAKEGKVPQRKDNSGRSKGAQDEEKIQSSATTANPSPFTPGPDQQSAHCQLPKQTGTSQRRKCAGAMSEIPETMPVKNRSNQSDKIPDHAKEGKVPQRKENRKKSKGAQDEEKIQSSATTANPSPFTPGPDQQSANCQLTMQTGSSQTRECAGAMPEIPETMPVKNSSNQSDKIPDHAKEGKVPQRKESRRKSKGAQDEEKIESSATTANPSPLTPGPDQQSAYCQLTMQTGSSQTRECAGHLGDHSSRSASAGLSNSSEGEATACTVPNQDVRRRIEKRLKALPLKRVEKIQASGIINGFIDPFIRYLKECPERPYFKEVTKMTTGSYYELVKISHPDEFDVMLALPVPGYVTYTKVDNCDGLYYKVTLLRKSRSFPTPFLLEDGSTVSPVNVLEEFRRHVRRFIASSYKVPSPEWKMMVKPKKQNCPAVTVMLLDDNNHEIMSIDLVPALEISGRWPDSCKLGEDVEKWLGKKSKPRNNSFYFVAKQPFGQDDKEVWRISFSHIEKEILNNHGNAKTCCEFPDKKCCRKKCIQLMKSLLEDLKTDYPQQLKSLCSYYVKTSFLRTLTQRSEDSYWKRSNIDCCFLRVLDDFIQHVKDRDLPHFFVSDCNLFRSLPPKDLKFLLNLLEEQRSNGLQAFENHKK